MSKYKNVKLFDTTNMPRYVCNAFMNKTKDVSNDVAIEYYVCDENGDINGEGKADEVDAWLIKNGANAGEMIWVKRWW